MSNLYNVTFLSLFAKNDFIKYAAPSLQYVKELQSNANGFTYDETSNTCRVQKTTSDASFGFRIPSKGLYAGDIIDIECEFRTISGEEAYLLLYSNGAIPAGGSYQLTNANDWTTKKIRITVDKCQENSTEAYIEIGGIKMTSIGVYELRDVVIRVRSKSNEFRNNVLAIHPDINITEELDLIKMDISKLFALANLVNNDILVPTDGYTIVPTNIILALIDTSNPDLVYPSTYIRDGVTRGYSTDLIFVKNGCKYRVETTDDIKVTLQPYNTELKLIGDLGWISNGTTITPAENVYCYVMYFKMTDESSLDIEKIKTSVKIHIEAAE